MFINIQEDYVSTHNKLRSEAKLKAYFLHTHNAFE